MLKITIQNEAKIVALKLEGRIAEPWVTEFNRTWRSLAPSLDSKKLFLDLRGVTFIDADGRHLLAEIYGQTGAEFRTDSLLTGFVVHQVMRDSPRNGKEN